ncbi:Permease of the drug/metabolite transporter (DMT) superfamily [Candidatus Burkholderia verschuerenii]|uniref:Permease of the drug/metabolite transporter (DMT) superfamily n=1 Tax=Candidatus Burkholderia verschuerenii TaxID=242163 RepID=A0A0L0M994_9BURK|nr:EamA family transporter [Candidatus Burkholderia verschuerenii]KND58519.1 Permease of the drug/metabolite transporter (DMT) superfamily [Candidatus Burkholderia verschuerenii]
MTRTRATIIGSLAVILWSSLAALTIGTEPTPPLLLNSICFTIGGLIGLFWTLWRGNLAALGAVRWPIYLFGTLSLFGYHVLYFYALRLAPAAGASLIAYLWPLLIVLLSSLLPNERFKIGHMAGAVLSFCGAALIIANQSVEFSSTYLVGFALAAACALTWSSYSVISRRFGDIPTESVFVFCLATAAASWILHFCVEETVFPQAYSSWIAISLLGLGPVGIAFYFWDVGVKRGNIQLLGTISYAAPLLSTFILFGLGKTELSLTLILAAFLITSGAIVAARVSMVKSKPLYRSEI